VSGASRTTGTVYDAIEGMWPATITNPLGQVTRASYHCGLGVLAATVDPNGVRTQRQYDYFGRLRSSFDDQGHVLTLHYDRPDVPEDLRSAGLIVTWQDVLGRTGRMLTDDLGREIKRSEMAFDVTRQTTVTSAYDAVSGKVGFVSRPFGATGGSADPNAVWRFNYDEIGRLTSATPPNESAHTIVHEGLRRTESVGGVVKGYTIADQMGRVVLSTNIEPTSTAPNHEIQTSYDYGPFGTLRHVRPPGGGIVTLSYDHRGRRTQIIDPDAGTRTMHLNAFGEIVREELPGQPDVVTISDLLGRPVNITSGDAVDTYHWDTAANGIGKLAFEKSASGVSTAYAYQSNGLPQSTTWTVDGATFAFDWTYSASALLTAITYPDIGAASRFQVTFGYGGDGRIGSLFAGGNAFLWGKTGTSDDGQVNGEAFGDGLASIRDADSVTGHLLHLATGSGAVIPNPIGSGRSFENAIQSLGYEYFPMASCKDARMTCWRWARASCTTTSIA
jgi:YD repeat-containing protein